MLILDEHHRYVLDGQILKVRSVTRVLRKAGLLPDYSEIDPVVLEAARARGKGIHYACMEMNLGVAEPFVDTEWLPYVRAYQRFLGDSGYIAVANELPLYHPEHEVAGVPDTWGHLHGTEPVVLDYKATYSLHRPSVALQLAAYRNLIAREHPGWVNAGLFALHLRRNGRYTLEPCDLPNVDATWFAALAEAHGRGTPETAQILTAWKEQYK